MLQSVPLPEVGLWGNQCHSGIQPGNHRSSWKPGALPPATLISRTSAPHQACFPTWLISELNPNMCVSKRKSLGPDLGPSCKGSWEGDFPDFYLGEGMRRQFKVVDDLKTWQVSCQMLWCLWWKCLCFNARSLVLSHCKRQKSTRPVEVKRHF